MNELFQQNVKDYFDKLTIKDFVNRNNLQPNPDTEWAMIVSLTFCSYKDKDFKDFLNNKRDNLEKCICAGFLENFERFNDDPQITGLYYYYKYQISRQRTKLNQIKSYIKTQSSKSLKNKLISLTKSFNCYKRSFDSKQTLYHGVTDILSLFTPNSLSFLRDSINSLRSSLDETFTYKEIDLNRFKLKDYESNIENTFSFMYKTCSFYESVGDFKLRKKLQLPDDFKEEISESINELDEIINEIPHIFEESTLPYIVKIDFFLQCSWLVSLIYSTIAHPPVQMFKEAYLPDEKTLPPDSLSKLPLDDDDEMEAIIDQMGKKKQLEFDYATEVLDVWRSELRKFDKRYQKLYFPNQVNQNIVDIIESKQLNDNESQENENETQNLTFNFPEEFSSFPNSMAEIKEIIEEHIIKFFKSEKGEEIQQEEEEAEQDNEYDEYDEDDDDNDNADDDPEIEEEEEDN